MKENLTDVLPKICDYFGDNGFKEILNELEYYDQHVTDHYRDFEDTKAAWVKIINFLKKYDLVAV